MRKIIDLTPVMVKAFLESVDEVNSVDDVQMMFKEFERQCIKGLYDRMYKQFPYDANSRTARSTDVSERKIRYIVNN